MIGALIFSLVKKYSIVYSIIIANFIIFIITRIFQNEILGYPPAFIGLIENWHIGLGFRPIYLTVEYAPQLYTLFTSMFIHGGFIHILGNMIIFFFIGAPFEERIGAKKFIIIYILTGFIAVLTHSLLNPGSESTVVGASGAIFGIMGAFAVSYPRDKIVAPIGFIIAFLVRIRVIYAVAFWAALGTILVFFESTTSYVSNTAHFAHFGGLLGGFILGLLLIRPKKTKSNSGSFQTVYYDSYSPRKTDEIDFAKLEKLATTPRLKQDLEKIKNETVPQVRDIWLEHFIEKVQCPKCGASLYHFNRKISCQKCGFKINI
jgi:membrane associated rhomboid family serine protease